MFHTYSAYKTSLNSRLHNKLGVLSSPRDSVNNSATEVWAETRLKSAKRQASSSYRLFDEVYSYTCPSDLEEIIDIAPQSPDRTYFEEWTLVTEEEFDRRKTSSDMLVAISQRDSVKKLLINKEIDDSTLSIDPLDDSTDWHTVGGATNLSSDSDNYIKGSGSIEWDIDATAVTTAGIYRDDLDTFDLTDYITDGTAFVWVYLSEADDITNFIVKLGSSTGNYYSMTTTTAADGTAFTDGWNLLKWDFSGATETGTVDDDGCVYASIYMTKLATKVSQVGFRFDQLQVKLGVFWNVLYYSDCPWRSSTGTYKTESTTDSDILNVEAGEYPLLIEKGVQVLGYEVKELNDADRAEKRYEAKQSTYTANNPSEAKLLTSEYYRFGTTL